LLSPLLLAVSAAIKVDSDGPVFFRQERVGRGFRRFRIFKFRTMVANRPDPGLPLTVGHDSRVTRVGRFLRHSKLDELPQLINVLKGEMSLVGPRPEVPRYVEHFRDDYVEILRFRPGITDPAALTFIDETALLGRSPDPELLYRSYILPEKLKIGKAYAREASLATDLAVILRTLARLARSRPS
jgi:lipopolysaccharide/colanic/teichoic acid biosynthesis glycosyltransferase